MICSKIQSVLTYFRSPDRRGAHVIAALIGAGAGTILVTSVVWRALISTSVLRYADSRLPMVDTPDAYFFLYRAQEMLAHGLDWAPVSALSTLLALQHRLIWLPLEVGAFWLPVLLGVACGLCYAAWGRLLRLPAALSGLAALLGTLSPAFATRVHAGNLDTDGLIFLLLPLCLYTLARRSLPAQPVAGPADASPNAGWPTLLRRRAAASLLNLGTRLTAAGGALAERLCPRFAASCGRLWCRWKPCLAALAKELRLWLRFALCGALLAWLWFPALLLLPCGLWLWGLTWRWASNPRERRARATLAVLVPLFGIPFLLLTPAALPPGLATLRAYVLEGLGFLINPRSDVIYQSIAELQIMTPEAWLTGLGGSVAGGLLMIGSFLLLLWRSPRVCLFLLPLLLLQGAAYTSNRFLFFGTLPMALGAAALPLTLPPLLEGLAARCPLRLSWQGRWPLPPARLILPGLALCVCAALLWSECARQPGIIARPSIGKAEDEIALALRAAMRTRQEQGQTVALMNWWDEGYFLRYRTGTPAFFDGGTQAPLPAFIAARGFALDHPQLARLWIRYFALHGGNGRTGWAPLSAAWHSDQKALDELSALYLLPAEQRAQALSRWPALTVTDSQGASRTLSAPEDKQAWLFPAGHVYIFLPLRFLNISPWWMAMGDRLHPELPLVRKHLELLPRAAVSYDEKAGLLHLPQAILNKGYTTGTVITPTPQTPFIYPWGADKAEPLILLPSPSPFCFITNKLLARTTAFRLLAPSCETIPGFAPVAVNFVAAGAWEVLE